MSRRAGLALLVILALAPILIGGLVTTGVLAGGGKSYDFPEVTIDATVNPDGSLSLHERRTFDFRGDFTFAFFNIEPQDAASPYIEDFRIHEDGVPVPFTEGFGANGGFEARWDYQATDETRTWDFTYTVRCAVDVYEDTAHLDWQFIGEGWSEPTRHARVTVRLPDAARGTIERPDTCFPAGFDSPIFAPPPAPKKSRPLRAGEVRAWGHGPLAGEVRIPDPQTVTLEVRDLRGGAFVEGSILFPAASVPQMALDPGGPGLAAIASEEQRLAREANDLREAHERETGRTKVYLWLPPLAILALFLIGRRRDRVPEVPRSLQEPPEDLHPARLALLWGAYRKRLGTKEAYRAQLLHLVQEGVIVPEGVGRVSDPEDITISLGRAKASGHDAEFLDFLVRDADRVSLKEVTNKGSRREPLEDWWDSLGRSAKRDVKKISKGRSRVETNLMAVAGIGAAVWGLWRWTGFVEGFEALGLVGLFAAWMIPAGLLPWIVLSRLSRPWLPPGLRRRMAGWAAFRRFLTEFSTLEDAPALAVIIWERYLVYAVALGVADRVEKQVQALIPEGELATIAPSAVDDGVWRHSLTHTSSARAYAAPSPAASVGYSSGWGGSSGVGGGGGGFSGGGGGGGGGTGGGAG